jgi:5-methylcytosine-specific restriction protein A
MDFQIGRTYHRRRDIHQRYGGQQQGGISTPADVAAVFLFTGESGEQYGYHDGLQSNGLFWYTGEGQAGDMQMVRGNLAIKDAEANGKTLHLFEQVSKGFVRYQGEATYVGHHEALAPDKDGKKRRVIVFELSMEDNKERGGDAPDLREEEDVEAGLWNCPLHELRDAAISKGDSAATATERAVVVRKRSQAVKVYVLRRANGSCECCEQPAPFKTTRGRPYLEPHHIRRLADGGPDHPRWVAAICPTCHRRIHHGADGYDLNKKLGERLGSIEP